MKSRALWSVFAAAALVACNDAPSEVEDGLRVSIDGPDVHQFSSLGEEVRLSATVTGDPLADPPRWTSSRASVVTVDAAGLVRTAGNGTAYVSARVGTASDSVRFDVTQAATQVMYLVPPGDALRGRTFFAPVRVAIADARGTPMRSGSHVIRVSLDAGGNAGALAGTTNRAAVDGVATFDDLSVSAVGSGYRLIARGTASSGEVSATGGPFNVLVAPDVVRLRNTTAQPNGLLVDGGNSSGPVDDLGLIVADSSAEVLMVASPEANEVFAFTRGRPPLLVQAAWTAGVDTVTATFPAEIRIPMTVWIVRGPYDQQRLRAASAITTTESIWDTERMGLSFSDIEFVDATGNAAASTFFTWTLCALQQQATTTIGRRAGRINVYYVQTVDGGTDRGRACGGGDFIIMAERSGHELLAHEIGHLFTLGHVDDDSWFDQTNVMHSASNVRAFLTEGQVSRSHFNASSALRIIYNARPDPVRTCGDRFTSPLCVPYHRRLFTDGLFPPNQTAQPMDAAAIVMRWLESNCGVGGATVTAMQLRALGDSATTALLEAADGRPPAAALNAVTRAASMRWRAMRERLRSRQPSPLDAETRAALLVVDEATYVARASADFVHQWRAEALRGLGVMGAPRALDRLRAIASDSLSLLAEVARQSLGRR